MEIKEIFTDKDKVLSISDIAEILNLHPQTIRNWEEQGLLSPQRLNENNAKQNGRRIYAKKEFIQIEKIMSLKKMGMNIQAIKFILSDIHDEKNE